MYKQVYCESKIYTRYTLNDAHDDLQIAIYILIEWANKWQLQISITKCSAFRIANLCYAGTRLCLGCPQCCVPSGAILSAYIKRSAMGATEVG